MPTRREIHDFLAQKRVAVVGVSRDSKQFANGVYRALKKKGYQLYPVNPNAQQLEGDRCYPSVSQIPETVDGALVMVSPGAAEAVVRDCCEAGIRRVWLGNGAVSPEAVRYCREQGMSVVDGACPMMFAEPVGVGHRCHRFVMGLAGKLPS
ncbi:MAG: CoA-binding protein [Chloroflexota bacterium]